MAINDSNPSKRCSTCSIVKPTSEFGPRKKNKDGFSGQCRACIRDVAREYRKKNAVAIKTRAEEYYEENKEQIRKRRKLWYEKNRDRQIKKTRLRYSKLNKEKERKRRIDYYYQQKATGAAQERRRKYYLANKEAENANANVYQKSRRASDPLFSLRCGVRTALCNFISRRGYSKKSSTQEIIGCTWEFLKEHIESQFPEGMSWENRSQWHIDHRIPLAKAATEEELIALCHYSNLQPMWAEENLAKGDKVL